MEWLNSILGSFKGLQFWIVIAPWEQGLRVRLGKTGAVLRPGLHFRLPWLDRIFVKPTRARTIANTGQTLTTKDGHTLTVAIAVTYSIVDIGRLYLAVTNPEETLLHQVAGKIADYVAQRDRAEVVPQDIEQAIQQQMPSIDWGLGNVSMMITSWAFCRTLRIMQSDWRSLSPDDNLETHK